MNSNTMERIADLAAARLGLKSTVVATLHAQAQPDGNCWFLHFHLDDGRALDIQIKPNACETNESIRNRIERALDALH